MTNVGNQELEIGDYIRTLLRYWWVLVLTPVLLGSAVYGLLSLQTPVYQAEVRILVQQGGGSSTQSLSDVNLNVALIRTYTEIVGSKVVLQRAGGLLSPSALAHFKVHAAAEPGTQIMNIYSQHPDPAEAAETANIVAESFIGYIKETQLTALSELLAAASFQGVPLSDTGDFLAAQIRAAGALAIIDQARPPSNVFAPQVRRNSALAFFLGMVLALPLVFGLSRLRNKIDSLDLLEHRFGIIPLGAVSFRKASDSSRRFVINPNSNQGDVEQFRNLRANVEFRLSPTKARTIAVSSAGAGEGKSTISTNLAGIMAFGEKKVLIIDADMRRPSVHLIFETANTFGLSNYLAGVVDDPAEMILPTGMEGLSFIPSGPLPPNPTELLASPQFASLLDYAKQHWDLIVVDTPPVLVVADASVVAPQVDGLLLVVDRRKTKISAFGAMMKRLNLSPAHVLGAVLNKASTSNKEYGSYYYGSTEKKSDFRGRLRLPWSS